MEIIFNFFVLLYLTGSETMTKKYVTNFTRKTLNHNWENCCLYTIDSLYVSQMLDPDISQLWRIGLSGAK